MTSPRPETLNRLSDIVFDKVMRTLRTPDKNAPLYELLNEMMTRLDNELDLPLKLSATVPSSKKLLIRSNRVQTGDGGQKSLPPDGTDYLLFADTTIDFGTGAVSGGTVKRDGAAFALPNVTVGQYVRVGFAYSAADNWVDTTFSAASSSLSGLSDPGTLLSALTGTKVGYIDLESDGVSSFKTPGQVSGYIENAVSGVPYICRFMSGGGTGGGGTGDASTLRTRLENQLQESIYDLLTPVDFAVDQDSFVDPASTGTYAAGVFDFSVSGQTFVSIQLLDSTEFLADPKLLSKVDVTAFWDDAGIDTAAVYELSRNGGTNWQTVSGMERVGSGSNCFVGSHDFSDSETNANIENNTAALTADIELNTTSQTTYQSQFTLAQASVLKAVEILTFVKNGSPQGFLYVEICEDNAGSPGNVISASSATAISGLVTSDLLVDVSDVALKASTTYWVVLKTDALYKASFSTGVTSISVTQNASGLRRRMKGYAFDLRLRITSSAALKSLSGFGVFYQLSYGQTQGSIIKRDIKTFLASSNPSSFALNFIPDPDLLQVFNIEKGQVYRYPSFVLNGSTVTFPANTFLETPDTTVTLLFTQLEGTSFDNSDLNAALLAANHLGSTDAQIDRSAAGYGIYLRRPDGVLREIALDNSDNLVVYSV